MAQAAYEKKVQVSTTSSGTFVDLPATSPSLDFTADVLDSTELDTNAGWRSRVIGLHDWSVSADSYWDSANAGLSMVRAAKLNRTALYVQYLPDGTTANGYKGKVVVENFNLSGDIGGLETVAITLQGDGALGAA